MMNPELITAIRTNYQLEWQGIHGVSHWTRVRSIGLKLAEQTGANSKVVELFSFLHDSCRQNDNIDPDHGPRAAEFAASLNGSLLHLSDPELNDLMDACRWHTGGRTEGFGITVLTCWDADRLDLGRVGIIPHPRYLCTDAGRSDEMIQWAYEKSLRAE